ncbi:MAG TPA: penicillin-binding protein, partial [Candidatus Brocadiia bacterium]|nr:penicillin-binding protein [Candidatus Brocadiia bacterium]
MTSGAHDKQIALRRAMVTALLLTAFALLAARLAWIQCAQRPQWDALATRYHQERRPIAARRGMILDCRGRRLAISVPVTSIGINPRALEDEDKPRAARLLAGVLRLPAESILERLQKPRYFVWLKRRVTTAEEEAVRKLELAAIEFRQESLRVYPNGSLAAHVLGAAGVDGQGLAGVELTMDKYLAGHAGSEVLFRDGLGRLAASSPGQSVPPVHGRDVILTLDANIQRIAEEELASTIEKWKADSG